MRCSHLLSLASGLLLGLMIAGGIQLARQEVGRRTLASLPAAHAHVEAANSDSEPIESPEPHGRDSAAVELRRRRLAPRAQTPRPTPAFSPEPFRVISPDQVISRDDLPESLSAQRFQPLPSWASGQHWINGQRYYIVPLGSSH